MAVSVRDIAGLYIYDNTLLGIKLTGTQVKAYLEKSSEYFIAVAGPGSCAAADVPAGPTSMAPSGTPDDDYDVMSRLDQPLTYDIDLSQAPGSRITHRSGPTSWTTSAVRRREIHHLRCTLLGVRSLEPIGTLGGHDVELRTDDVEGRAPLLSGGEHQVVAHRVGVRDGEGEPGARLHLDHREGDPHPDQCP